MRGATWQWAVGVLLPMGRWSGQESGSDKLLDPRLLSHKSPPAARPPLRAAHAPGRGPVPSPPPLASRPRAAGRSD